MGRCVPALLSAVLVAATLARSAQAQPSAPVPSAEPKCDVVATLAGDRYSGTVLGIGADGWIHLTGPQFKNDVAIALSAVEHIDFSPAKAMRMGLGVTLTNGDFVFGQVQSITPEQTTIANPELGTLSFPTAALAEIRPSGGPPTFVDTSFDSGDLGPWTAVKGKWDVREGRAVYSGGEPADATLSFPLVQKSAVTFAADVEPMPGNLVQCVMCLCAGRIDNIRLRSGVVLSFWGGAEINVIAPDAGTPLHNQPLQVPPTDMNNIRLRLAYDPKESATCVWVGDNEVFRGQLPNGPKEGQFVSLGAAGPLVVKRLRVMPGIVPPDHAAPLPAVQPPVEKTAAESQEIQVTLANGDVMSSKSVTLADGRLTIQTEFGEMQVEAKKVALVRFPQRHEAAAPEAPSLYFDIRTSQGRLTLRSCSMTDETFFGRSDLIGDVSFKRELLLSIRVRRSPPQVKKENETPAGTDSPAKASNPRER